MSTDDNQVLIVGAGLIGASIGLGLSLRGCDVVLRDTSPTVLALARDVGAGRVPSDGRRLAPGLVVVATPPDVTIAEVRRVLDEFPHSPVTDVASVKAPIVAGLTDASGAQRFVGGHPMAGRERSGPLAARADLFEGRPWVITPSRDTDPGAVRHVSAVAATLGATVIEIDASAHDEAVAVTSHLPQVAASLVAGRLRAAEDAAVSLSGQGLRDVTRIADSDPVLWAQILAANADPVRRALVAMRADIDDLLGALTALSSTPAVDLGARAVLARVIAAGNEGRSRIPTKHGMAATVFSTVAVRVSDRPGEISRLLTEVGAAGVNLEDIRIEHSLGRPTGVVDISVLPAVHDVLAASLTEGGWVVVE